MPFSVENEHIKFFNQHSAVEFVNLLNLNQHKILSSTIGMNKNEKDHSLIWGFDLWRTNSQLKPILCSTAFAKIAGQLKNMPKLRYAYSQYLGPDCFSKDATFLSRKSFIKELVCGLCLCIKPATDPENPLFPLEERAGVFFDIDSDFLLRFSKTSGQYLFIFFAEYKARFYIQEKETPHQTVFKKLGYHHGEFLRDELNPSFDRILL
ncbi:MAG: hypothetical protein S4CHLAM6_04080 [Chlamydiae bacterium]|nr:hypothetical protein [Chlamydiota bacterium]